MLHPENVEDLIAIAAYLKEIEKNMEALKLVQWSGLHDAKRYRLFYSRFFFLFSHFFFLS